MAVHPAQQRQGLAFDRMPLQYDPDRRRKAIEVGSVALVRSILFRMSLFCVRSDDTPTSGGFCCTWSAGSRPRSSRRMAHSCHEIGGRHKAHRSHRY